MIYATAIVAGWTVGVWLCCDWAQIVILWLLGNADDDNDVFTEKRSFIEEAGEKAQEKWELLGKRVDSVHSRNTDNSIEQETNKFESRRGLVQVLSSQKNQLACPVAAGHDLASIPSVHDSDSSLRCLGWLP